MPFVSHYVPKFILKNFAQGKSDSLYVFDKRKETSFKSSVRNVAAEKGFYDFQIKEIHGSIEESMAEVETKASPILKKIISSESLAGMTAAERSFLSAFIALQMLRVKHMRDTFSQINKHLEEWFKEHNIAPENVDGFKVMSDNDIKSYTTIMLTQGMPNELAPHIFDKIWMLFKTTKSNPFYISDNPIALQNFHDRGGGFRGNLGLCVPGIEIYFPISKCLSLAIFCRSHQAPIKNLHEKHERLKQLLPGIEFAEKIWIENLMDGLKTGHAISISKDNVINLNSLQVVSSSRFIFSCANDFSLAMQMISDDSKVKDGRTLRVGHKRPR